MKARERHQLKENEFAATTARVVAAVSANRDRLVAASLVVVVLAAIGGGYWYWQRRTADRAGAMLGVAMAIVDAQIVPAPTLPGATQQPGTFPTEKARDEASLKALQEVASLYPSTQAGLAARYQVASSLMRLERLAEAEQAFRDVADRAGSSVYGPVARLGVAETLLAQGKNDDAIKAFSDLAADRDGLLPVDGVLMQLARACAKAGKPQEARAAFKRVVDEFPESSYVADARRELALLN
jgi:TolA-binding protein